MGVHLYEDLLAAQPDAFDWPDRRARRRGDVLHERHHREPEGRRLQPPLQLPALDGRLPGNAFGIAERDRILPVVPMFHANAWGLAYAGLMSGAALIMPDRS